MAQSDVELGNNALLALGQGPPLMVALSDTTKQARICNQKLPAARRALLRMHPWNFAVARSELTLVSITGCVSSAGLVRVTATGHGLTTGDDVTIESVLGTSEANGQWVVTVIDANNVTLVGSTFTNTYVSGGLIGPAPKFDYSYMHTLPTDCLRVLLVNQGDGSRWRIEGRKILTDDSTVELKYVKDETDYTKWDALAYEALSIYLAWTICQALTQNVSLKDEIWKQFDTLLPRVRFVDSTEDPAEELRAEDYLESRIGANQGFVRDPLT